MNEYEVLIETINPCGGEAHANKEFKEIEAESPESYVAQNGSFPVIDSGKMRRATPSSPPATARARLCATRSPNNLKGTKIRSGKPGTDFSMDGIIHGLLIPYLL